MGEITKMAYNAITNDELLFEKCETPEAVLDYLQDESSLKSLSMIIKDAMISSDICNDICDYSVELSVFTKKLYSLLRKQSEECGKTAPPENTVRRWLNGETKSIRKRLTVIEICFALKLDYEATSILMNKCGYNSFNVRNAEDATYLYCILSKKSLANAQKIISAYYEYSSTMDSPKQIINVSHSDDTTVLLKEELFSDAVNWQDDEQFLNTFLLPNKCKFTNYSNTALKNYYMQKNLLFATVLINNVKSEESLVSERAKNKDPKAIKNEDIPTTLALRSALKKYTKAVYSAINIEKKQENTTDTFISLHEALTDKTSKNLFSNFLIEILNAGLSNDSISLFEAINLCLNQLFDDNVTSLLHSLNNDLDKNMTATDVLVTIRNKITSLTSVKAQRQLSVFFSDIIKTEGLLKSVLISIVKTDGDQRIRRYTGPNIVLTEVMKEFPDDKSFAKYEKTPSIIDQGLTIRKAIILMYYITYAYEYSKFMDDYTYNSELFSELGFNEFIEGLDEILSSCNLPPLYPANQFDWLILRSIREFEVGYDAYDDPIKFFNDVLTYSFGEEPIDEES